MRCQSFSSACGVVALSFWLVLALAPQRVRADTLCTQRTFSPPVDLTRSCDDLCASACGASMFPGFAWQRSASTGQCTCTCREPCATTLYATSCTGTTREACQRGRGCVWDTGTSACVFGAPVMSAAPIADPRARPVMGTPWDFQAVLEPSSCEVLANGEAMCVQPVAAQYPEQLESIAGEAAIAVTLSSAASYATPRAVVMQQVHTRIPDRLPSPVSMRDLAYGPGISPNAALVAQRPSFELRTAISPAQLELARAEAAAPLVVTTLPSVNNNALRTARIECATPELFVQYLKGFRTSSLDLRLGSPNDVAGVCDACAQTSGRLATLTLSTVLGSELPRLARVRAYARPLTPTLPGAPYVPPPLVPAFTGDELKLAAAELRYTIEQTRRAYAMNRDMLVRFDAALFDLRLGRWSDPMLVASLEGARFVYQLERTATHLQAFALALTTTTDNLVAFDRYVGRATPALPTTDWRFAMFAAACPAPEYCGQSHTGAQRALLQAVADVRAIIADRRTGAPWLSAIANRPELATDVVPADEWFKQALAAPIDSVLSSQRTAAFQRVRDLAQFGRYLDCSMDPPLQDAELVVNPASGTDPYQALAANAAYVRPRFDELLAYVSEFPVAGPIPPAYDATVPETKNARLEALWLDGAYERVRQRREAVLATSLASSAIASTAVALTIFYATSGLGAPESVAILAKSRRLTQFLANETVRMVLGGVGALGEVGGLAAMTDACQAFVPPTLMPESTWGEDPTFEQYRRCIWSAQLYFAGSYFAAVSMKTANRLGTWPARPTGEAASAVRRGIFQLERVERTAAQRYIDWIIDGPIGLPHPQGLRPGDPLGHRYIDAIAARIQRGDLFANDAAFASCKNQLVAGLRAEVDAGLSPDHASILYWDSQYPSPLILVGQANLSCVPTYASSPVRFYYTTFVFWHELSHATEESLKAFEAASHFAEIPILSNPAHDPPWRLYSELTATVRQFDRDAAAAVKDVRRRYADAFVGSGASATTPAIPGYDSAFPELATMTPHQQIELFRRLAAHPEFKLATGASDFLGLRATCHPALERLIREARSAP